MEQTNDETKIDEPQDKPKKPKKAKRVFEGIQKTGKGFFHDFKEFLSKGNVMNLAVAFIMGVAFTAIVTSLVNDIFMPFLSIIFGKSNIGDLAWVISPDLTIYYGKFILAVVNFLLIALVLFLMIKIYTRAGKGLKKLKKGKPVPEPVAPVLTKTEELLTDIKDLLVKQNEKKDK